MAKVSAAVEPSAAGVRDDQWRIPQALWERIEPLLPPRPPHPLGCHNSRVYDRKAMDAIFFVLRTGCQWNALNERHRDLLEFRGAPPIPGMDRRRSLRHPVAVMWSTTLRPLCCVAGYGAFDHRITHLSCRIPRIFSASGFF